MIEEHRDRISKYLVRPWRDGKLLIFLNKNDMISLFLRAHLAALCRLDWRDRNGSQRCVFKHRFYYDSCMMRPPGQETLPLKRSFVTQNSEEEWAAKFCRG